MSDDVIDIPYNLIESLLSMDKESFNELKHSIADDKQIIVDDRQGILKFIESVGVLLFSRSVKQKREAVIAELLEDPDRSDRVIACRVLVSQQLVAKVRREVNSYE